MLLSSVTVLPKFEYSDSLADYISHYVTGDFLIRPHLDQISRSVATAIQLGKEGREEGTPYYQSLLQQPSGILKANAEFLLLDFGGTNTKASICTTDEDGNPTFTLLFEKPNSSLGKVSLEKFLSDFTKEALDHARTKGLTCNNLLVGVVWSNALDPVLARSEESVGCAGVSGLVTGKDDGSSYNKPEDVIAQAVNEGDDVGLLISSALMNNGVNAIDAIIVTNDTVAIGRGHICAVASTGTNYAVFDPTTRQYHNTELGNIATFIPEEFLSDADLIDGNAPTLEMLTAGAYAPTLFAQHVKQVAELYSASPLNDYLKLLGKMQGAEAMVSPIALSELIGGNFDEFCRLHPIPNLRENLPVLQELKGLACSLRDRAATILACASAGAVEFLEYYNEEKLKLGLDSSQARLIPGYYEKLDTVFTVLVGDKASLTLLHPVNKVSVPTQGMVYFLSDLAPH